MYYRQTWPAFRLQMGRGSMSSVPVPGSGLTGLGDAETATECPEPVSTADRDRLRKEIGEWTSPWHGPHIAEGHPDIKAAWDDMLGRLRGLYERPKLLRCSKEARNRAGTWLAQQRDLCSRVKSDPANCSGYTVVPKTFTFAVFRGPTYTIRAQSTQVSPGRTIADVQRGTAAAPAPASSAPPGSVVVNGQVFPSSAAAAAAAAAPPSSPAPVAPTPSGPAATTGTAPLSFPISIPSSIPAMLEGEVMGIPTMYLVYGLGGLLAYKFLFGKGR